jgi:hypothetical protein
MRRRWREPAAIAAEIDRIRSLRLDALRRQWRLVFGRVPPAGLSKDLLGRMIAARLQERAFGGLDRDSLKFLQSLARHERPPRRQLKPGTVTRSRVSRPALHRHDRSRRLRLAGNDISEPLRDRRRHHRHVLEWAAIFCPARGRRRQQAEAQIGRAADAARPQRRPAQPQWSASHERIVASPAP